MSIKRLTILGTSAQVPTFSRNHSGYFLLWDGQGILLDPGEGTQRQMTLFGTKASSITKILISHFHGDHCLGLPGVIQRMRLDGVDHPVDVYFPASGMEFYRNLTNAVDSKGSITLIPHPVKDEGTIFEDEKCCIQSYYLQHPIDTLGFRIKEKDSVTLIPEKLKAAGIEGSDSQLLKEKGKVTVNGRTYSLEDVSHPKPGKIFAFITDTAECAVLPQIAANADLLLSESTYLSQHSALAETYGHLTARQAAKIANNSGVRQLVLTHFSQRYSDWGMFLNEARAIFENVAIANDGDVFELLSQRDITNR